jgi:hypothetical protein
MGRRAKRVFPFYFFIPGAKILREAKPPQGG